jgi:PEP-CTERM motif
MKPELGKNKQLNKTAAIFSAIFALPFIAGANSSFTINTTTADAFLASGSPGNPVGANLTSLNFGGAGTLAIAPASSPKGEFDSVIQFNSAAATSQFNATYGAGKWQITGLTLLLASNFATQGQQPNNTIFNTINAGNFGIDLISDNNWVEGTGGGMGTPGYPGNSLVSFNSIPTLLSGTVDSLGTFTYTPPGNGSYLSYSLPLNSDLVTDATAGGAVSLYFFAADDQVSYLFNSKEFGSGHPELTLTVTPTPEPGTLGLLALGSLLVARRWKNRI